jgi:purine-binding chemotaxis protein CheW
MKEPWFFLSIGGERYALPIDQVHEVIRATRVVRIPQAPAALAGALLLRGAAIPVIDVRRRLGATVRAIDPRQFFVVGSIASQRAALITDAVEGLRELDAMDRDSGDVPLPPYAVGVVGDADGRSVVLLDLEKILESSEAKQIQAAMGAWEEGARERRDG